MSCFVPRHDCVSVYGEGILGRQQTEIVTKEFDLERLQWVSEKQTVIEIKQCDINSSGSNNQ